MDIGQGIEALADIMIEHGVPGHLRSDNGLEIVRIQTSGAGSVALRTESGVWKSGKHKTLSTCPYPRRRLSEFTDSCATLTLLLHKTSGRPTVIVPNDPSGGSWMRRGRFPYFDLSALYANLETSLWVYGRSVNDVSMFEIKPGSVVRTFNAVVH
jgi:hypothetical protein